MPVTVFWSTADGTATGGNNKNSDYRTGSGTLTFNPGQTSLTVTVRVIGDRKSEPNETFSVNLSGATNATIADAQGLGTILNDDGGPGGRSNSSFFKSRSGVGGFYSSIQDDRDAVFGLDAAANPGRVAKRIAGRS